MTLHSIRVGHAVADYTSANSALRKVRTLSKWADELLGKMLECMGVWSGYPLD